MLISFLSVGVKVGVLGEVGDWVMVWVGMMEATCCPCQGPKVVSAELVSGLIAGKTVTVAWEVWGSWGGVVGVITSGVVGVW